ncbi:putative signal peptide protein [Puccinia sorghi]|uniref:Putative signal peptide protein n=1 Tax=Puccinia sorghi TaxID=27349 RepID=A0A0L6U8D7_9BASI|nr:putative signal peptide protein [Puccinia sorghi]
MGIKFCVTLALFHFINNIMSQVYYVQLCNLAMLHSNFLSRVDQCLAGLIHDPLIHHLPKAGGYPEPGFLVRKFVQEWFFYLRGLRTFNYWDPKGCWRLNLFRFVISADNKEKKKMRMFACHVSWLARVRLSKQLLRMAYDLAECISVSSTMHHQAQMVPEKAHSRRGLESNLKGKPNIFLSLVVYFWGGGGLESCWSKRYEKINKWEFLGDNLLASLDFWIICLKTKLQTNFWHPQNSSTTPTSKTSHHTPQLINKPHVNRFPGRRRPKKHHQKPPTHDPEFLPEICQPSSSRHLIQWTLWLPSGFLSPRMWKKQSSCGAEQTLSRHQGKKPVWFYFFFQICVGLLEFYSATLTLEIFSAKLTVSEFFYHHKIFEESTGLLAARMAQNTIPVLSHHSIPGSVVYFLTSVLLSSFIFLSLMFYTCVSCFFLLPAPILPATSLLPFI